MKLAWKEIKYSKTKYLLVEMILVLMIFMVLFLSGLANGLARAVSSSVDNADASYYVLSDDAEKMITISQLTTDKLDEIKAQTSDEVTALDIQRTNLTLSKEDTKLDVTYFAIDPNSFLMPKVIEGKGLMDGESGYTIVLDDSFAEDGIAVGDIVEDSATGLKMTVVGFTTDQFYGHTSVGFITTDTYTAIRKETNPSYEVSYHAAAIQGTDVDNIQVDGMEVVDKATIIDNLPGYSAEQTTINMILWVLVVVSAAILGVFFYVITIQKQKQFGVLKAIGMDMRELTGIIVSQVLILSGIGMALGNILAFGMANLLPSSMPFYMNGFAAVKISVVFILISVLCSLISTRKVAKVDPIITIGGNES